MRDPALPPVYALLDSDNGNPLMTRVTVIRAAIERNLLNCIVSNMVFLRCEESRIDFRVNRLIQVRSGGTALALLLPARMGRTRKRTTHSRRNASKAAFSPANDAPEFNQGESKSRISMSIMRLAKVFASQRTITAVRGETLAVLNERITFGRRHYDDAAIVLGVPTQNSNLD